METGGYDVNSRRGISWTTFGSSDEINMMRKQNKFIKYMHEKSASETELINKISKRKSFPWFL